MELIGLWDTGTLTSHADAAACISTFSTMQELGQAWTSEALYFYGSFTAWALSRDGGEGSWIQEAPWQLGFKGAPGPVGLECPSGARRGRERKAAQFALPGPTATSFVSFDRRPRFRRAFRTSTVGCYCCCCYK